ncbi:MAG: hypothetical protein F6K56_03090 [Moorea sp. SIO3G5]|nr:hypothetical protein [Moorena sp. SIO3G5]
MKHPTKPKVLSQLIKNSQRIGKVQESDFSNLAPFSEPLLLPYQIEYMETVLKNRVVVWNKSRRIGASWVDALYSVLQAGSARGQNQYYICYNKEATRQYIDDCRWWAARLQMVCNYLGEVLYRDEDRNMLVFRLQFASGHKIEALSSKPSSIRGKQGGVCIDEVAFHPDPKEMVRSVMALLIWDNSSRIRIISTPDTVDNFFYELVQDVKTGKRDYAYLETPFQKALDLGLFQRICYVNQSQWSIELQTIWEQEIRDIYRPFDAVELDCEFLDYSKGGIFDPDDFQLMTWEEFRPYSDSLHDEVIAFDLATTAKEMGDRRKGTEPFYTFGVHMARHKGMYFVLDIIYAQADAEAGDRLIMDWVRAKKVTKVVLEEEPGSSGKKYLAFMRKELKGFKVLGAAPKKDKLTRARPFAHKVANHQVYILSFKDHMKYISWLSRWPTPQPMPLISDAVDASVHAYQKIQVDVVRQIPVGSSRGHNFLRM